MLAVRYPSVRRVTSACHFNFCPEICRVLDLGLPLLPLNCVVGSPSCTRSLVVRPRRVIKRALNRAVCSFATCTRYPFLLPNLLGAFLALLMLPLVAIYVPETKTRDSTRSQAERDPINCR